MLMENATGRDRAYLLAHPEITLQGPSLYKFERLLKKRLDHVPIAYILGKKDFYGLEINVNTSVLIPRPETEELVSQTLKHAPKNSVVLDLGTGSGAIAVAVKVNRPDLQVSASDISDAALNVARGNAAKYNIHDISFIHSDLMNDIKDLFAVIVANLPYLPDSSELSAEVLKEPKSALFSGSDGLDHYRRLFVNLKPYLDKNGYLILESEPSQQPELVKLAEAVGFKIIERSGFCTVFAKTLSVHH